MPISHPTYTRRWPPRRLPSRRAESSRAAKRIAQLTLYPLHCLIPGDDHLRDAVALVHLVRLVSEIQQDYPDLPPIAGVNRGRGVGESDRVFQSEAAAGSDLCFKPWRKFDRQTCRN